MEKQSLFHYIKKRIKEEKIITIILAIYAIFTLTSSIYSFCINEVRNGLLSLLFFSFTFLFYLVEYLFKIKLVPMFVIMIGFIASGALLGTCYNFYHLIPSLDTILHGVAGIVFACLGYTLMQLFIGKPTSKKTFFACLFFGVTFSLTIALVWEVFEYTITCTLGFDMMEDSIVTDFNSYYLSGDHSRNFWVNDITSTYIFYGDNEFVNINGYLDLGLVDTLHDMIICLIGSLIFMVLTILSWFKFPKINKLLLPTINEKRSE